MKGEVSRVLVVAPRIALDVWRSELHKHSTFNYTCETFTHEWSDPHRVGGTIAWFLAGREETFRATRVNGKLSRPKQDTLKDWRPDAIIFDESHEYKRPGARGAQDAWRLVSHLRNHDLPKPYVLLLTGTPSAKGWRDLFAQFRIMDPQILGTNVSHFDERYCVYGQGPRKYTVIRYKNINTLQAIISTHSSSCTAQEAHLEGRISFNVIPFDLPPQVRSAYDELSDTFVTEVGQQVITAANVGVKRLRLLQLTSGYIQGQQIHRAKVECAQAWLELLAEQGQHVVVYARFTAEVDGITEAARKAGFDVRVIDGRTARRDRLHYLQWFRLGRRGVRALVFQYQSGSQAIELSTAAELVFLSLPDGWVQFWQCLNRVRGPNQTRPVRITAILARNTVDRSVLYGLRRKEDIHRLLLKDPQRFLRGEY